MMALLESQTVTSPIAAPLGTEHPMCTGAPFGQKIAAADAATMALPDEMAYDGLDGGTVGSRGVVLWQSDDGMTQTGVWAWEVGRFRVTLADWGEVLHLIAGEMVCTADGDGQAVPLRPGDAMVFARGWTGAWEVRAPVRATFTNWYTD